MKTFKSFLVNNPVKLFVLLLLTTLSLNAMNAFAAPAQAIAVSDTDLSAKYLNMIFGSFGPLEGVQERTIMGQLMMVWNGAALLLGTILVGYIIMSGVLKTAHEGEFLGRQWSSIWVPFRSAIAMSMILPLATGYSLIQAGAMWCVLQGIGVANLVNDGAMTYMQTTGGLISTPQPGNGINIAANVFKQQICVQSLNKILNGVAAAEGSQPVQIVKIRSTSAGISGLGDYAYTYGVPDGTPGGEGFSESTCGGMDWGIKDRLSADAQAATANGLTVGHLIDNTTTPGFDTIAVAITSAQSRAISDLELAMAPAVRAYVNPDNVPGAGGVMPSIQEFNGWVARYNSEMASNVNNAGGGYAAALSNLNAVADGTRQDGWISLGSYFTKVTHINDVMANLIDAQASNIAMDFSLPEAYSDEMETHLDLTAKFIGDVANHNLTGLNRVQNNIQGLTPENDNLKETASAFTTSFTMGNADVFDTSNFMHYTANMFSALSGGVIHALQKDENPITRMQNLGNMVLTVYGTMKAVEVGSAVISGGSSVALKQGASSGLMGKGIEKVMGGLAAVGTMLLVTGICLAVIMPMVPYLLWTLGVFSWFTSVLIAMVAAPLWAVAHATPGGDDAMGSGSNGYLLLMSITLRPVLMIFGFYGGMLLLFAIDRLVSASFIPAFTMMNSNSQTGPMVATASILIYAVFNMTIIFGTFKLIQALPDAILQWIGGRDDDMADARGSNHLLYGNISNAAKAGQGYANGIGGAMKGPLKSPGSLASAVASPKGAGTSKLAS